MKIKLGNKVFDENELRAMVKELNSNCAFVNAHGYNKFLNKTKINGVGLIDLLKELRIQTSHKDYKEQTRSLGLTQKQQFKIVIDFFNSLDKDMGKFVKSILHEKNENYKLHITTEGGSHAGHHGENEYIDIFVELKDTVDNLHQLPHELAHAMSGHHTQVLEYIKKLKEAEKTNDPQQIELAKNNLNKFTSSLGRYDKDCVGEIESHIVERLFYKYLLDNKIISKDDYKNYRYGAMNSFDSNLKQILEENKILNHLPCPITFEAALDYAQILQQAKSFELLGRMHTMSKPGRFQGSGQIKSEYAMRYVVAEMVASQWYDLYKASNEEEKQKMIKHFKKYLTKTGEFNVEDATKFLLNKSFAETIDGFFEKLAETQTATANEI